MPAIGASFTDERISMTHWYPRIAALDAVRTPETHLFDIGDPTAPMMLDGDVESFVELLEAIPTQDIVAAVESLPTNRGHIRGDYKASRWAGGEGRFITADHKVVDEEVLQLLDSRMMTGSPFRALAVRECINMAELADGYMGPIGPEVRFIIDEGDVLGWFVDIDADDFPAAYDDEEIEAVFADIHSRAESDEQHLRDMAATVAQELDETGWSVDFIQSTDGEWVLTDMALYGLWWHEEDERWRNISHIPENKDYNLETNRPDWVPDEPTDDMVRTSRKS